MLTLIKKTYSALGRYRILYLLSAIELALIIAWSLYSGMGRHVNADTPTYYNAYDIITSGRLDSGRTPLYPLLIGLPQSLFGSTASLAIVYIFQSIVFICSIRWLGKLLDQIISNQRISYLFTAIYALYPGMLTLCGYILSESLSVSLMSLMIYLVSEAYYHNSYKKAALSGLVCMIMWLQRPALMYISVIMVVFWICILALKGKGYRKTAVNGLCITTLSIVSIGVYSAMFYKEYHKPGLTSVTTINNYLTIREAGAIDIESIESPGIKADMDSLLGIHENAGRIEAYREVFYLVSNHPVSEVDKFITGQMKSHPGEIMFHILVSRRQILASDSCVITGAGLPTQVFLFLDLLYVNNGTAFVIFLAALSLLLYTNIRMRQISCFIWLLLVFFTANYFTIWVAAPDAFCRLSASNYPVLTAVTAWLANQFVFYVTGSGKPVNLNK